MMMLGFEREKLINQLGHLVKLWSLIITLMIYRPMRVITRIDLRDHVSWGLEGGGVPPLTGSRTDPPKTKLL